MYDERYSLHRFGPGWYDGELLGKVARRNHSRVRVVPGRGTQTLWGPLTEDQKRIAFESIRSKIVEALDREGAKAQAVAADASVSAPDVRATVGQAPQVRTAPSQGAGTLDGGSTYGDSVNTPLDHMTAAQLRPLERVVKEKAQAKARQRSSSANTA